MWISALLRQQLETAGLQLMIDLRLNRRLYRMGPENSENDSTPGAVESRRSIESRTAEYVSLLKRYRESLEEAIQQRNRSGLPGELQKAERRYAIRGRRTHASPKSQIAGRRRHRA
jgi:hypothetical protein